MAFIKLTNSTTADADEVMGDLYFIGAGDRPPYFQTTAGGLSEIDNTYDLGSDTAGWRRLYAHNIGDSTYSYHIRGGTVTAEVSELILTATSAIVNSTSSLSIDCTATMQQIYNPQGTRHKGGPIVLTEYISIGSWDMANTNLATVDVSHIFNTTSVYCVDMNIFINADTDVRQNGYWPTYGAATRLAVDRPLELFGTVNAWGLCYDKSSGFPLTVPSIYIKRPSGGQPWDGVMYNDSSVNRGYIKIVYTET